MITLHLLLSSFKHEDLIILIRGNIDDNLSSEEISKKRK